MGLSTDDPRRPLYAAAKGMTIIGAIYLAFGLLITVSMLGSWPSLTMLIGPSMVVAAIILLICGSTARQHCAWAVWSGIAVTLVAGVGMALLCALVIAQIGLIDLVRFKDRFGVFAATLLFGFTLAHVWVLWNLSNSFEGLREPVLTAGGTLGFEPLMPIEPRPALPVEDSDVPPTQR